VDGSQRGRGSRIAGEVRAGQSARRDLATASLPGVYSLPLSRPLHYIICLLQIHLKMPPAKAVDPTLLLEEPLVRVRLTRPVIR